MGTLYTENEAELLREPIRSKWEDHWQNYRFLIAEQLHRVMLDLGKDAQRVGVLAVSVEPMRDTVAAALTFSQAHHMTT